MHPTIMMHQVRDSLHLTDSSRLKSSSIANRRSRCTQCARHRMYFCYDCRILMPTVVDLAPQIKTLPTRVDIIKHRSEKNGKSTAIHCAVTAPTCVRIYDYPSSDDFDIDNVALEKTVLLYPTTSIDTPSTSIDEYVGIHGRIDRMIFLDASWYQVPVIRRDARLQHIPTISLDNYVTDYWRPQTGHNDSHLATVEAVYYALREYHLIVSSNYHGQFDDLLFWFYYFRDMVMRVK